MMEQTGKQTGSTSLKCFILPMWPCFASTRMIITLRVAVLITYSTVALLKLDNAMATACHWVD